MSSSIMISIPVWTNITKKGGLGGGKSCQRGWIAPCLNTSLPKFLLVTLMTLLPGSIEGLMGLREEQQFFLFLQGTRARQWKSPFQMGVVLWATRLPTICKPESMVGTMRREPSTLPWRGGSQINIAISVVTVFISFSYFANNGGMKSDGTGMVFGYMSLQQLNSNVQLITK